MSDADDPGVVGAAVVQRVDPNLAAAAPPLESPPAAASLAAEAQAIRISCFGKEGIREWRRVGLVSVHRFFQNTFSWPSGQIHLRLQAAVQV